MKKMFWLMKTEKKNEIDFWREEVEKKTGSPLSRGMSSSVHYSNYGRMARWHTLSRHISI